MEILINNATYVLKNINAERRQRFCDTILQFYNRENPDLNAFIGQVREVLLKEHKKDYSHEKVKQLFFKQYGLALLTNIWHFLQDADKTALGKIDNMDISQDAQVKFFEWVCDHIKQYSALIKSIGNPSGNVNVPLIDIYSYLAREYGWELDKIKEMSELDIIMAVEKSIKFKREDVVTHVNSVALATAYASGSKSAKHEVDKLNSKLKNMKINETIKNNPDLIKPSRVLTRDELVEMERMIRNGG